MTNSLHQEMTQLKYHLTPEGPKKCSADVRQCKYQHFPSLDEAYSAIEEEMTSQGRKFVTVRKAPKKKTPAREDITESLERVASTKSGLARVEKTIDSRLETTDRYVAALESRDPLNPEATQPVRKGVYGELKKRFNGYRDRTAQLVEASENSPHKVHKYVDKDLEHVGTAYSVAGHEPNTREWLEARQQTVGGSDVGALAENDFTDEDEKTYFIKRNMQRATTSKINPVTDESVVKSRRLGLGGSGPLYRGTVWEDRIRDRFAEDHPDLTVINSKNQYANTDRPWQQVNVDGILSSDGGKTPEGILEIKTGGVPSTWEKGVPTSHRAQTLYYLNATGLKYAKVRVCLNDTDHRDFTLHADDEVKPGSGVTMGQYIKTRVGPWHDELERERAK